MEERRLNLNAPLLSVRRNLSSASVNATGLLKGRIAETSRSRNQPELLASKNVDRSTDQVTELVSVPFTWEEVPGKAKDDGEPEILPSEETMPPVPVIARNSLRIHDDCSEQELTERSQTEKGTVMDEDERYSDAVDTLSPVDSFSVSYSISSLGDSDGTFMKPSGTFSVDMQTRDFMMGRFLPAARALAIASESSLHHASRKPHLLSTEQPKEVEKRQLLAIESGTPSRQHNMEVVKYCTQALCLTESSEEEEEEGDDGLSENGTLTEKGCGLLTQLCLRSSLQLLNPVPGIKSKIKNSLPFIPAIRTDLKDESTSQAIVKSRVPHPRSEHHVETSKFEVGEMKPPGGSNLRSFLGELQRIGRSSPFRSRRNDAVISDKRKLHQPAHPVPPLSGSRKLSLSGELQPTHKLSSIRSSMNDVAAISENSESPWPPRVVPTCRGSNRVSLSGELRTTSRLSPFRPSRNDNVSSEKGESPRSYYIGPLLGRVSQHNFPGELRTTSMLSPFQPSRNEVVTTDTKESSKLSYTAPPLGESSRHRTSRLSPCRPSRSNVANPEKNESSQPSYVVPRRGGLSRYNFSGELRMAGQLSPFRLSRDDVTNSEKKESTQPSYVVPTIGRSGRRNFSGEMQTQQRQYPLRLPRNHSTTFQRDEKKDAPTPNKAKGCICPVSQAFERTLYADTISAGCDSCSNLNVLKSEVWMDPVASREVEEASTGKSSFQDVECLDIVSRDQTLKEVDDRVVDPSSPLPLPLLKSPSESWLWHTLPSKSDRSQFSSLQKPTPPSKNHVPNAQMPDAKWETIVKTSKTHHDHTRYSEELIEHALQRYKS